MGPSVGGPYPSSHQRYRPNRASSPDNRFLLDYSDVAVPDPGVKSVGPRPVRHRGEPRRGERTLDPIRRRTVLTVRRCPRYDLRFQHGSVEHRTCFPTNKTSYLTVYGSLDPASSDDSRTARREDLITDDTPGIDRNHFVSGSELPRLVRETDCRTRRYRSLGRVIVLAPVG